MGNWRTVRIIGTCSAADVPALRGNLTAYQRTKDRPVREWNSGAFHCLCATGGIFGIGDWSGEKINAHGNLAERDYDVEEVAYQLAELAKVAPSLTVKVHCGGDYEDTACIATVALADGAATIGPPEVADVGEFTAQDSERRFLSTLMKARLGG